MYMDFETSVLPNGIRLVHGRTQSPVAYLGVMVNTGTRDELEHEHGMAHFIEHVLFKGTHRRKAFHITSRLENVGGDLNAYTTKEETVVHATVLKEDFHRAMELLYDIVYCSTFPEKELAKEKDVILDEINSYKDSPSELIFDDFEELLYPQHPFGRNILGSKRHIKRFTKADVESFISRNYKSHEVVVCSMGKIPFHRVEQLALRYFGNIPAGIRENERIPISYSVPQLKEVKKGTYQKHCIIGSQSYHLNHENRVGMLLLTNILGGPGQNSRLNMVLRERNGLSYNVEAVYSPYSDTGVFSIYFGTDKINFERALELIYKEMKSLKETRLGSLQLTRAKKQLMGQLAIASENSESLMLGVARSYMLYNSIDTVDEVNRCIERVTANGLLTIANEMFDPTKLSTLIYL